MKYCIITFGCRVNQADSAEIEEGLQAGGLTPSALDAADVVVVNTCSVTAAAEAQARQMVRRIARAGRDRRAGDAASTDPARIYVTGCYATRRPEDLEALPGVAAVLSNSRKASMPSVVLGAFDGPTTAERFAGGEGTCGAPADAPLRSRTRYTLRVQTGCEERCSYCIIPSTRGRQVSTPPGAVVDRVRELARRGYREIVLTGVHLGSYGRDLTPPSSLLDLARVLEDQFADRMGAPAPVGVGVDGCREEAAPQDDCRVVALRLSSLEPMDVGGELIDLIAGSRVFVPYLHLPLQHASDSVLARMRRPYTLGQYNATVRRIRERIPDAAIGCDVITGFPGETDEDHRVLADYLAASPLTGLHVFPYSDRPGTAAASLDGKVPGDVARARGRELRQIGQRLNLAFRRRFVGRALPALALEGGRHAITGNGITVTLPGGGLDRNEWLTVEVLEAAPVETLGRRIG